MPRLIPLRLAAACALALVLSLSTVAVGAAAKGSPPTCAWSARAARSSPKRRSTTGDHLGQDQPEGDLLRHRHRRQRQVGHDQRRRPRSACSARRRSRPARCSPLLITDAFDFGLGLCGVGSSVAKGKASWYLKVNHKGSRSAATRSSSRPATKSSGRWRRSVPATRTSCAGGAANGRRPACRSRCASSPTTKRASASRPPGAKVTGAQPAPTDADGKATRDAERSPSAILIATHGKDIPSPRRRCLRRRAAAPAG